MSERTSWLGIKQAVFASPCSLRSWHVCTNAGLPFFPWRFCRARNPHAVHSLTIVHELEAPGGPYIFSLEELVGHGVRAGLSIFLEAHLQVPRFPGSGFREDVWGSGAFSPLPSF